MSILEKIKKNKIAWLLLGFLSSIVIVIAISLLVFIVLKISSGIKLKFPLINIPVKEVIKKISTTSDKKEVDIVKEIEKKVVIDKEKNVTETKTIPIVINKDTLDLSNVTTTLINSGLKDDIFLYYATSTINTTTVYKKNIKTGIIEKIVDYYSKPNITNIKTACPNYYGGTDRYTKNQVSWGALSPDKTKLLLSNNASINILDLKTKKIRTIFKAEKLDSAKSECRYDWKLVGITDNTKNNDFGFYINRFSFSYDNRYLTFFIGGYEGGHNMMIDLQENKLLAFKKGKDFTESYSCFGMYGYMPWSPVKNIVLGAGPGTYMCYGIQLSDENDVTKMNNLDDKLNIDTLRSYNDSAFSKDGNKIVLTGGETGIISLVDLKTNISTDIITSTLNQRFSSAIFSSDDKKIYYVGQYIKYLDSGYNDETFIFEYDIATKKYKTIVTLPNPQKNYFLWSSYFKTIGDDYLLINGVHICKDATVGCGSTYLLIDIKNKKPVYVNLDYKGNAFIDILK